MRAAFARLLAILVLGSCLSRTLCGSAWADAADEVATRNSQGVQLYEQGKYAEAFNLAEQTLLFAEKALGPRHPGTLSSVNNLAFLYQAQGRYGEAEPLYKRALAGREQVLGAEDPDTLLSVNNLAFLYQDQGRYGEAEPLYKRALAGREQALGAEDPDTLRSVNNLGALYLAQGRYREAEPLYKRALAGFEQVLGAEDPDTLLSVNNLAFLYQEQGRYGEAEPLYKRALAGREQALGPEHPDTLMSVNNLAALYLAQGRYGEAEPLYKRALAGNERALGAAHPYTLSSVNNLAFLYNEQGRYGEAESLYKRALAGREQALGAAHPDTLTSIDNLAALYQAQGRYGEAEPLFKQALAGREQALGAAHLDTLSSVNNLAFFFDNQGRYGEAESLYKRALAGREQSLGAAHPDTLLSVNNLGALYLAQGRYGEAEPLYKRALAGREQALGAAHPDTLLSINNLAYLYNTQGRYGEAELLYKRALAGRTQALGPEHPDTLVSASNLGANYQSQGRSDKAEPLYNRALAGREQALGAAHPDTLMSVNNVAFLYQAQGRYSEAEPLYKRALAGYEKALGAAHPYTLSSVSNLGFFYQGQGRYGEAEPLYKRALAGREQALGPDHPDTLVSVNNLATIYFEQGDWARTAQFWKRSTAAIAGRVRRGVVSGELSGKKDSEAQQWAWHFWGLVKAGYRLPSGGRGADAASADKMFQAAQWALSSEAAKSVAQMAVRGAKGDAAVALMLRDRQDLVDEWQRLEKTQAAALAQESAKRDVKTDARIRHRMTKIDGRIAEIDAELDDKFPDYAALASPAPLSVADVQAQLGADEALVLFLDTPEWKPTPEETFIWVVTKTDLRWVRSDIGEATLAREKSILRCGLDYTAWRKPDCAGLTGKSYDPASYPKALPPFDTERAHRLYKALFGEVENLIKDKHLLVVPSGALTQLPFSMLVTTPPQSGDLKAAAWMARDHPITVLPAVSSLKALRATSRLSTAAKPMIGFGNPLLYGSGKYSARAKLARDKQACLKTKWQKVAKLFDDIREAIAPLETRGGLADVRLILSAAPLPETADELCDVARDVGADINEMRLGARATEHEVKEMSRNGGLADYRVVHFATHGAMAGDLNGMSEPGLILTPPDTASDEDDGYLSAPEVAALKLDADLVILSACNTAAGNADSAEALSGMARAFIYAQTRALLVSHWEVYSDAAVTLITSMMRTMAKHKHVGRAEALRRAMRKLIDTDEFHAHPAIWAPFIVVGEGSRQ